MVSITTAETHSKETHSAIHEFDEARLDGRPFENCLISPTRVVFLERRWMVISSLWCAMLSFRVSEITSTFSHPFETCPWQP